MSDVKFTPMMEQYFEIKNRHKDCLLFFRLGDFYELFFDDALTASKELEITLTGRDCGQQSRAPMCGVPFHSADAYIARLVEKGYNVAICEQLESPSETKKIVKRDVVRIITPGTVIDNSMLESGKNNYVMAVSFLQDSIGIAVADVSSGSFFAYSITNDDEAKVIDEFAKFNPSEIISNKNPIRLNIMTESIFKIKIFQYNEWVFDYAYAKLKLQTHFGITNLAGFGIEEEEKTLVSAAGGLIDYLLYTQKNSLGHITKIQKLNNNDYMILDLSSRRNLSLPKQSEIEGNKGRY